MEAGRGRARRIAALVVGVGLLGAGAATWAAIRGDRPLDPEGGPRCVGVACWPGSSEVAPSERLRPPPTLRSEGGVLATTLTVAYGEQRIGDRVAYLRGYNGGPSGPVLRVRPGDTLKVHLVNDLPATAASAGGHHGGHHAGPRRFQDADQRPTKTEPGGFNTTNLHTHGLWVSPSGVSDNVLVSVGPGETFDNEIHVPEDHPPGTHWYHAHHHGSVALQVSSGLAGMLIVEGGLDDLPEIRAAQEQILMFQQFADDPGDCEDEDGRLILPDPSRKGAVGCVESYRNFSPTVWRRMNRATTINGQLRPTIRMRPGEVQRWRMLHAGVRSSVDVAIYPASSVEGWARRPLERGEHRRLRRDLDRRQPLYLIAEDGIAYGRMDRVSAVELEPGYRADALVKITTPGRYALIDEGRAAGLGLHPTEDDGALLAEPPGILGWIVVEGDPVDMPLPTADALRCLAPHPHIEDAEITGCQSTVFAVGPTTFTVNDVAYMPGDTACKLPLGEAQEWHLRSAAANHPYHIHVNPFEVLRPGRLPVWKDTMLVRSEDTQARLGKPPLVIRTRYRRFPGEFVMHCHILDHEDMGMMQLMEVMEDPPPLGDAERTSCVPSPEACPYPMDPQPLLAEERARREVCGSMDGG